MGVMFVGSFSASAASSAAAADASISLSDQRRFSLSSGVIFLQAHTTFLFCLALLNSQANFVVDVKDTYQL